MALEHTTMFLDDTFVSYKARVNYSFLAEENLKALSTFIKSSGIRMPFSELKEYTAQHNQYKYALIAKIKNETVGVLLFTVLESELFVNHLYVTPVHRFKGIGSTLMAHVKQFKPTCSISYLDTSTNFMPWMHALNTSKKKNMMMQLGSFYKPKSKDKPEIASDMSEFYSNVIKSSY